MKQGLGLAIGATLMDLKRATTLASVTVMTFMLAGGFFVKVNLINIFFYWTTKSSFSDICSINLFKGTN